jgi:hypothetical protein
MGGGEWMNASIQGKAKDADSNLDSTTPVASFAFAVDLTIHHGHPSQSDDLGQPAVHRR